MSTPQPTPGVPREWVGPWQSEITPPPVGGAGVSGLAVAAAALFVVATLLSSSTPPAPAGDTAVRWPVSLVR